MSPTSGVEFAAVVVFAIIGAIALGLFVAHLQWSREERSRQRRRRRVDDFDPTILLRTRLRDRA